MKKPILVIKFGSSSLTTEEGNIDERIVLEIARQCASLQKQYDIVIVSSGAVASGKKFMKGFHNTLADRKAAAAIGNPLLVRKYSRYFKPYNIAIAQSLCERRHFADRHQFLQLKSTYEALWRNNVIPIANENDVVSNKELKFSDNDELATLIAVGFGAEKLLMATSAGGVLDEADNVIPQIDDIDRNILALVRKEKTTVGLGGMTSKLNFARKATRLGIDVIIFSIDGENNLLLAEQGKIGTWCKAQKNKVNSRLNWLATGSLITGLVKVDTGARKALQKRSSLLAVGVKEVVEPFESGEVFHIADPEGDIFAVAKAKIDFDNEKCALKEKDVEVAHANDIVLL